jgi:hypothetical protein
MKPVRFVNRVSENLHEGKNTWARILDLELYDLIKNGFFKSVSPDVEDLTGKKGKTVQEFFHEEKAVFTNASLELTAKL